MKNRVSVTKLNGYRIDDYVSYVSDESSHVQKDARGYIRALWDVWDGEPEADVEFGDTLLSTSLKNIKVV